MAQAGYDAVYGARPLKRYIQRELETRIGRALICGELGPQSVVEVTAADGVLRVDLTASVN